MNHEKCVWNDEKRESGWKGKSKEWRCCLDSKWMDETIINLPTEDHPSISMIFSKFISSSSFSALLISEVQKKLNMPLSLLKMGMKDDEEDGMKFRPKWWMKAYDFFSFLSLLTRNLPSLSSLFFISLGGGGYSFLSWEREEEDGGQRSHDQSSFLILLQTKQKQMNN